MTDIAQRDSERSYTSRIAPLANLPVFFKLSGKRVLLAGGGEPALWKAELLSSTGARVEVFAEDAIDELRVLAASSGGNIVLNERSWKTGDLAGAAMAVGAFADESKGAEFAAGARRAGVPVNVVDRPQLCDFQFGAVVNRSPLVVGISTDGAAPVFGQAVRSLIEGMLPDAFRLWAAAARDMRRDGAMVGESVIEKRAFWRRFAEHAMRNAARGPTKEDLSSFTQTDTRVERGTISIVDVGDDQDELTLGAVRDLRAADDIFFEEDVPATIIDFARREARRHRVADDKLKSEDFRDTVLRAAHGGGRVVVLRYRQAGDGHPGDWGSLDSRARASDIRLDTSWTRR
jgi:uroporphyrin-III C-methyltransferase / precorrin-2 dehydrogenase / sirohydrochlorin ferrochelatase